MNINNVLLKYNSNTIEYIWEEINLYFKKKGITNPLIIVHGGYGKKNVGDDALCGCFIELIEKYIDNPNIIVFCHSAKEIAKLYPQIEKAYSFKDVKLLKVLINVDLYIIGGGGIINQINSYSGFSSFKIFDLKGKFMFITGLIAKFFGAKLWIYGIGATSIPDKGVKYISNWAIRKSDFISVRDFLSKKNIKEFTGIDAQMTIDPAYNLEASNKLEAEEILRNEIGENNEKKIGFVFRYVKNTQINNDTTIKELADFIDFLVHDYNFRIVFIPFGRHPHKKVENDLMFGFELSKYVKHEERFSIIKGDYNPKVYKAMLGLMDFNVLERLHSIIFSEAMNTPYIAVSYDNKVEQFVKLFQKDSYLVDLHDMNFEKLKLCFKNMVSNNN